MTKTRLPAEFKLFRDRLVLDLLLVVVLAAVAAAQPPRNQLCRSPSPQMIQESQQFLQNTPCAPVTTACAKRRLSSRLLGDKKGLDWECMAPLFFGKTMPAVEMLPTDSNVAACEQFCDPDFEKGKGPCTKTQGHEETHSAESPCRSPPRK